MKKEIGNATLYLGKMEDIIPTLNSVDCIFSDPPYNYIKTHDFDRPFNEQLFFENAKRLLPDDGFIALFGRGTSFYRWNTRLADLGFEFKEEIVWDKYISSGPCLPMARTHETISVYTKKTGKIRRVKIPYIEQRQFDNERIIEDINYIKKTINSEKGLNRIIKYLETGDVEYAGKEKNKHGMTQKNLTINKIYGDIHIIRRIQDGMPEKTIVKIQSNHHNPVHPTEKPVRLAERILALISDPGDTILDPFMGSGSFGVACIRTGRNYIGIEIDSGYFKTACRRIREENPLLNQ